MRRGVKLSIAAICSLGLILCVAAKAADNADGSPQPSGFLADYSRLAPAPANPNNKRWGDRNFDIRPYGKILLNPIEVWLSPASEYKGVSPEVLKHMSDEFNGSFRRALTSGYELVEQPGPGVLQVRLAITGVNLAKPALRPRDIIPIKAIFNIGRAVSGNSVMNVVLTGEMQALDPAGNVVAEAIASGTSDKTISEKQEITWKELQSVTDAWATALRNGLDTARGIAPRQEK